VRLYLPWTEPVQLDIPKAAEEPPPDAGHYTKVLIVEDDNDLREVATHLVVGLGYGACSASAGAEAIAKLEGEPDIGLVFTDILMPGGMSGFELAAEIRRRRPDLPILMMSGFPGHFMPGACESFPIIRKPFTQIELASAFLQVRPPSRPAQNKVG
jgi:CheY-like chemotaxis protein